MDYTVRKIDWSSKFRELFYSTEKLNSLGIFYRGKYISEFPEYFDDFVHMQYDLPQKVCATVSTTLLTWWKNLTEGAELSVTSEAELVKIFLERLEQTYRSLLEDREPVNSQLLGMWKILSQLYAADGGFIRAGVPYYTFLSLGDRNLSVHDLYHIPDDVLTDLLTVLTGSTYRSMEYFDTLPFSYTMKYNGRDVPCTIAYDTQTFCRVYYPESQKVTAQALLQLMTHRLDVYEMSMVENNMFMTKWVTVSAGAEMSQSDLLLQFQRSDIYCSATLPDPDSPTMQPGQGFNDFWNIGKRLSERA